jgi:O-succinylbenzoic acid--CoA ligase
MWAHPDDANALLDVSLLAGDPFRDKLSALMTSPAHRCTTPAPLHEGWLDRAVAARPAHTALETPQGSWTYSQLSAAAHHGAARLASMDIGAGARVAIALPGGLDFAQALHSCLLLGAVAVPIDPRLSTAEREPILAACDLLVEEPLGHGQAHIGAVFHDLNALALVVHTSGTTSAPRPVELTYGNLLWSALGSAVALGQRPEDRWLCALPLSHVGGLSILLRSCIYGTSVVLHERFEVEHVLLALRSQAITLISLVATTLARLLDAGLQGPLALRCALTGGGPVSEALVQRALAVGVPVSLTYGLTEACSQVTTTPVAAISRTQASAGPPLFCTRVRIAPDREILVRGPTVATVALAADGWLHTGDLGSLDEHGRLRVTGRKVETIVSGGENVAPVEVEVVIEAHPGVLEAAVFGRPDPQWGEAVAAIVVPRPGVVLEAEELRVHCATALARYKVPKHFAFSNEPLPRTSSGKLLRRELT